MHQRLFVLLPAHNEEHRLGKALASLRSQTTQPDHVVVALDNCTDRTADVATNWRANVFETTANADKKAGALNQALDHVLPDMTDDDLILIMDADSALNDTFLANAVSALAKRPGIGAVSATPSGEPGRGYLALMQRMEYEQYSHEMLSKSEALVLSGAATVFRVHVLRHVAAQRGERLPGTPGSIYHTASITEDNELTLAVKTLGWRCVQTSGCTVLTELMTTWRDLLHQRLRWKRGTLEDIKLYGINRVTLPYIGQQLELAVSVFARIFFLVMVTMMIRSDIQWQPLWLLVGLVFIIQPVLGVRTMGPLPTLVAAIIIPQLVYRAFQEYVVLAAYYSIFLHIETHWHHANEKEDEPRVYPWWRRRSRRGHNRHAGLHRTEHRLDDHRRTDPAVPRTLAVPARETTHAPVTTLTAVTTAEARRRTR